MRTIELNIDNTTRPQNLANQLKQFKLQQGDKLKITTRIDAAMALIIVWAMLSYLYEKKIEFANKVLKDVLSDNNSKELQNEISKEYGIDVEIKSDEKNENDIWHQFSIDKLSKAYSNDEPDYELSMVKEPNLSYKK